MPTSLSQPATTATDQGRRLLLRRGLTGGAGLLGAVAASGAAGSPAQAATRYRARHFHGARFLGATDRRLAERFSYGLTPQLAREVRRAGGARKWFRDQLSPGSIDDSAADAVRAWWPGLEFDAGTLWRRQRDGVQGGWEVMADYQRWLLVRRVLTRRPVHEMMTEFWMNHLNVPVTHDATFTYRVDYDATIRRHALGRFSDLLQAATTHPAMGLYLDNAVSTMAHPNENLGRELLELHTVGRAAYSEDDVKNSSRILTGYLVDAWHTFEARYSPEDHWTGPVSVLGFSHDNASSDGRPVVAAYLRYLARHPETAQRIARKLALKFVGDTASQHLVDQLARVYLRHDTAIAPVLKALVDSGEFARSAGAKVRDPGEDVVATYRALGVRLHHPVGDDGDYAATAIVWQAEAVGAVPCGWPRPDGQPIDNASWSSPARMLASMEMHWSLAGGGWPTKGIRYRRPAEWLPRRRIRFDELVDHLSQQLLGRRSTGRLLKACCQVTSVGPAATITADHPLVKWDFHRLLATILDSPTHMSR